MKIKINKNYVEDYQLERVKADAKDFSEAYTVGDLKRAFEEQVGGWFGTEVVKTEITAMDSGWALGNKTIFEVTMLIDDWNTIYRIHYYIDRDLEVDTRVLANGLKMYDIRKYRTEE